MASEDPLPCVRIRRATAADVAALVALEASIFPEDPFNGRQVRYLVLRARGAVMVAIAGRQCDGARLVGAAMVLWRRGGRSARLYTLAVAPDARGRGVGTRLLSACEAAAAAAGCAAMRLEVRAANAGARAFYRGRGYRPIAILPGYYEGGGDGIRMGRELAAGQTARAPTGAAPHAVRHPRG